MKYYKWNIYFEEGSNEGTSPQLFALENGNWLEGAFDIEAFTVYGYGSDTINTAEYSKWNLTEISSEEMLLILKNNLGIDSHLDIDGKIKMPHPNEMI